MRCGYEWDGEGEDTCSPVRRVTLSVAMGDDIGPGTVVFGGTVTGALWGMDRQAVNSWALNVRGVWF